MGAFSIIRRVPAMTVTIVNDHPFQTGLGRYAEILYNYVSNLGNFKFNFYSISIGYRHSASSYPGDVIFSKFDSWLNQKFPFVRDFPDVSHYIESRFLTHFINKNSNFLDRESIFDSVIHYTNPGIYPVRTNSKTIVTIHDLLFLRKHGFKNSLGDINNKRYLGLFKEVPYVITFTKEVKYELEEQGFTSSIEIIPPSISNSFHPIQVSKELIRHKLSLPKDKTLILSVSSNRPGKNLKTIEEVMESLGEGYQLVRVGSPLAGSITFTKVSDETLNEIYNACDILIFPSTEEGVGLPVIEAFAVGLPVVASDIEVMREVCKEAAILVEPEKSALAASIKEAIDNKENLIKKGLVRSLYFSKERFIKEMRSFYERVCFE